MVARALACVEAPAQAKARASPKRPKVARALACAYHTAREAKAAPQDKIYGDENNRKQ